MTATIHKCLKCGRGPDLLHHIAQLLVLLDYLLQAGLNRPQRVFGSSDEGRMKLF